MQIVRKPKQTVLSILGAKFPENDTELCLSQFTIPVQTETESFLFNTFTGECIRLEREQIPAELIFRGDCISDPVIIHLAKSHFYVRKNIDECERYCKVISIIRTLKIKKRFIDIYNSSHNQLQCQMFLLLRK